MRKRKKCQSTEAESMVGGGESFTKSLPSGHGGIDLTVEGTENTSGQGKYLVVDQGTENLIAGSSVGIESLMASGGRVPAAVETEVLASGIVLHAGCSEVEYKILKSCEDELEVKKIDKNDLYFLHHSKYCSNIFEVVGYFVNRNFTGNMHERKYPPDVCKMRRVVSFHSVIVQDDSSPPCLIYVDLSLYFLGYLRVKWKTILQLF